MARSKLTDPSNDLISDSGAVLWSFVRGEQLEYPVVLAFLTNAYSGYTFEAVVIEAQNEAGQTTKPTTVKQNGVQTTLNVRVPTYRGMWQNVQAYNSGEVTLYNGKYYSLIDGVAYVSTVTPEVDPMWAETNANTVYLQFPSSLAATWEIQATVEGAVYGFFELRVTEPPAAFRRTWKPVRGMVEILFSPTEAVPDV